MTLKQATKMTVKQSHQTPAKANNNAREAAITILEKTGVNTPVQALVDTTLKQVKFPPQEAALMTELVYGYLRAEIRIHWFLGLFLKSPEKLPPIMNILLGIAAYELLHLPRIPSHASVNTAVRQVRRRFGPGLAAVANGVLRSLARLVEKEGNRIEGAGTTCHEQRLFPFPSAWYEQRLPDKLQRYAVYYSVPVWILSLWEKHYGWEKTAVLAQASSCIPVPCIRVNRSRPEWEKLHQELSTAGEAIGLSGIRFPENRPPSLRAFNQAGLLSFQGAGSQFALEALQADSWEEPLWDACAGRGGKALALLEKGKRFQLISDTSLPRLWGLQEDARRLELSLPPVICASATAPAFINAVPPRTILLDVPCSGLGTLARHPDLRRMRSPEQLPELVALQRRMLLAAWERLPVGGTLIYITCTINPEENEDQIRFLQKQHPESLLKKEWFNTPDMFGTDLMYGSVVKKIR